MPFLALAVIAAIVFVQEGQRRIPVQYAKRVIGRRMTQGGQTYLPLRVNMAGVIPVIFAASIMAFPPTVGQLIDSALGAATSRPSSRRAAGPTSSARRSSSSSSRTSTRRSRSTPSTRPTTSRSTAASSRACDPGRPTAEFLDRILARLTFPGALFLAAVAALPTILINPTRRELLLRRHVAADRHRRRARHDEAARGAADDAQLRGLPEVAPRIGRAGSRTASHG